MSTPAHSCSCDNFDLIPRHRHSPLDLTKVRLQASGDKRMIASIQKTVRTAGMYSHPLLDGLLCLVYPRIALVLMDDIRFACTGFLGLFDGITGTWMRQMSYSVCRFWAYDESKKLLGASESLLFCDGPVCEKLTVRF